MDSKTYDILGVKISQTNPKHAVEYILSMIQNQQQGYVCCAPVSTIVDCQKDERYRRVVNAAALVTPDGQPVAWLGKKQGFNVERTYGPGLMADLCREKSVRHYFYGGTEKNNQLLIDKLKIENAEIQIAGCHAPGILKVGEQETADVLEKINQTKPDILWIGLGAPKQDHWMALHQDKLDVPVMIGVGAAFDFLAGIKPQAPRWMQNFGLEWFFRLCCEPKRLWKRYLIGNTYFIWLLITNCFKKK